MFKVGEIFYDVTLDTKGLIDGGRVVDREVSRLGAKLTSVASAIGILGAALAALKVAKLADDIRMLSARVDVAAGSAEKGAAAFAALVGVSRRTQTSLEGNIEVFNRLNQSILAMGGTQRDTLNVTELLSKAIKVSGASAVEAKAAMLQFGQALGSGKLQGDELRSLMETAPYLMRQLADGIGVPVGALKKLGEEGKLTADVVTNALTKAAKRIDEDFQKLPQTFEAAMTVAQDQAALAALKFDDLAGGSAVLSGVVKGLGDVLEQLGNQFAAATTEADKLGRSSTVKTWGDGTILVLSYVADAGDLVVRMFRQMGVLIGGVAAATGQLASGELANSAKTIAAMKRDLLDIGNAQYSGAKMRQALEATQALYSNEGRSAKQSGSKLTAPAGLSAGNASKFDGAGYIAGLEKETAEGYARINLIEEEALRKNQELMKAGKISRQEAARAASLIESNAARERLDLQLKEAGERYDYLTQAWEKEKALKAAQEEERKRGQAMAQDIITGADPIAKLQQELNEKSELLLQAYRLDQANEELYAQARVALEEQTAAKIKAIRDQQLAEQQQQKSAQLQAYGQLFDGIAGLTATFAGKQSGIYKAMFAVSKAFAIADAIVKIQQGIASAAALPFPANIPAMATVVAATSSIVSTIKGTNYGGGRQYGGPVAAGSVYRVGESNRPEMFVGNSGRSYMIPGEGGKVIGNGDLGGGVVLNLEIINNGEAVGGSLTGSRREDGQVFAKLVLDTVADDMASGGKVARATQSRFNLRA